MELSEIQHVSVPAMRHATSGHLSRLADMAMTYTGSLPVGAYVSLVDSQQNAYFPCISGVSAAATLDEYHSGPIQGAGESHLYT